MNTNTEKEMREEKSPWPKSKQELHAYIDGLVDRPHDYGTCVYALSLAAIATFNYVASKLGVTGFQASGADMDFIRRSRSIKGPFMIVDLSDELYGAGRTLRKVSDYISESRDWLRDEARAKLAERGYFHPDVFERLTTLADFKGDKHAEAVAKLEFLRAMGNYFPSEKFAESHVADFKRFGMESIHIMDGDISKYDKAEDGSSFRLSMPTSISVSREIDGATIGFSIDTEVEGSNGTQLLNFDFGLLEALTEKAKPAVRDYLLDYIKRAKSATADEALA